MRNMTYTWTHYNSSNTKINGDPIDSIDKFPISTHPGVQNSSKLRPDDTSMARNSPSTSNNPDFLASPPLNRSPRSLEPQCDPKDLEIRLSMSVVHTLGERTSNPPRQQHRTDGNSSSSKREQRDRTSKWRALEKAMHTLHTSAGTIPSVKSVVGDFMSCLAHFETAHKNRDEYDEVVSELGEMADYLHRHLDDSRPPGLTERIARVARLIGYEVADVRKLQEQSKTTQVLRAKEREEDLSYRFRRIGELFRRIQMEIGMSEWSNTYETLVTSRLDKLEPAKLARYNSGLSDSIGRRACTEDTRQDVLSNISEWCDNPSAPPIYWLNGMAGTGKTTVTFTLASMLESRGQLAASFFCTITSQECSKASRIIPTIAYQLSRQSTPFEAALVEVLKQDPDAASLTITKQIELLLVKPIHSTADRMARNLVVVIDALDECDDSNAVGLLLSSLFSSAGSLRLPVKFFITSRPEPAIYKRLASQSDNHRSVLHLHEVSQQSVRGDIRKYLREELESLPATESELDCLTELSGQLFIYAATAVRYIDPQNDAVDSRTRLAAMLTINSCSTKKYASIDALYTAVLFKAVYDMEPDERDNILSVVWTVVSSRGAVSPVGLSVLAGLRDEAAVLATLAPLRSVLHISGRQDTVSTFHASFPQFIFDKSRSREFSCDATKIKEKWALRCLRVVRGQLSVPIQPDEASPYLAFASETWASWLVVNETPGLEIYSELRSFFENCFENWLSFVERPQEETPRVDRQTELRTLLVRSPRLSRRKIARVGSWLKIVDGPHDLRRAAENAALFQCLYDETRQKIHNRTAEDRVNAPKETKGNNTYSSWIWEEIDYAAIGIEI
ncbi:unnamed protein product [Rhizoctonia solani]|uniref:NACHT domain-containing protein n=1 Tax=Rhizoctonia solani TaxID=456999 RepID=A0A8H3GGS7_9AGAM|nr:unnamed protein product [Rhizoctonia solani]